MCFFWLASQFGEFLATDGPDVRAPLTPWNGGRIDFCFQIWIQSLYSIYAIRSKTLCKKYQGFLQLLKCMCASLSSATRCHEIPMPRSSSNDEGLWWQHRDMDSVLQCCLFAKFWKVLSWRCWETPGVAGAHASKTSQTGEKICKATPAFLVHC